MKVGEGKNRANRIEKIKRRPRPGCDHDHIGEGEGGNEMHKGANAQVGEPAQVLLPDGPRPKADQSHGVTNHQQAGSAQAESGAQQYPEP